MYIYCNNKFDNLNFLIKFTKKGKIVEHLWTDECSFEAFSKCSVRIYGEVQLETGKAE